jgi:CheY-like chemotaxis protein
VSSSARDGQEAWEYLDSGGQACLVVLDLILPRLDGWLLRAKLLEHDEHARIPIIVFTAAEREAPPNAVAFVRKAKPDDLLRMIDQSEGSVLNEEPAALCPSWEELGGGATPAPP